jgi:hypothetical protein
MIGRIPPAVLTMPFDLMRHDMLMTCKPIPPERVRAIVDDLFMPLAPSARRRQPLPAGPPGAARGPVLNIMLIIGD